MSQDKPEEQDVERLVDAQARGEVPPGVSVEGAAPGAAELDTRRSKSGIGLSAFGAADTVVDTPTPEVDTERFILDQGGTAVQYDVPSPAQVAQGEPIQPTIGARDVNLYPDPVDDPAYIEAHARGLDLGVGEVRTPETEVQVAGWPPMAAGPGAGVAQASPMTPGPGVLNTDIVDDPGYIEAHARGAAVGDVRTAETEVQIGASQPAQPAPMNLTVAGRDVPVQY